jgi:hypothetical protein
MARTKEDCSLTASEKGVNQESDTWSPIPIRSDLGDPMLEIRDPEDKASATANFTITPDNCMLSRTLESLTYRTKSADIAGNTRLPHRANSGSYG